MAHGISAVDTRRYVEEPHTPPPATPITSSMSSARKRRRTEVEKLQADQDEVECLSVAEEEGEEKKED
jgi:hypothetical protein